MLVMEDQQYPKQVSRLLDYLCGEIFLWQIFGLIPNVPSVLYFCV